MIAFSFLTLAIFRNMTFFLAIKADYLTVLVVGLLGAFSGKVSLLTTTVTCEFTFVLLFLSLNIIGVFLPRLTSPMLSRVVLLMTSQPSTKLLIGALIFPLRPYLSMSQQI